MDFDLDDAQRKLQDAGRELGKRCRGMTPARAGEDWRAAGAKELLRGANVTGAAIFLDAYAASRGTVKAARAHAAEVIARSPSVIEATLLAGGLAGLIAEVVENLRLPPELRPDGFPSEKDPDVRRALADGRTWSQLARNLALRAAFVIDDGTPAADVAAAAHHALAISCDAVLKTWAPLSRLVIGEEPYAWIEADLFRTAARKRPEAYGAIATLIAGEPFRRESTGTAELAVDRKGAL